MQGVQVTKEKKTSKKILQQKAKLLRTSLMVIFSYYTRIILISTHLFPVPVEESISLIKEGVKFPNNLNGSDVRVGIIMARWNSDIIQGLYKVS